MHDFSVMHIYPQTLINLVIQARDDTDSTEPKNNEKKSCYLWTGDSENALMVEPEEVYDAHAALHDQRYILLGDHVYYKNKPETRTQA